MTLWSDSKPALLLLLLSLSLACSEGGGVVLPPQDGGYVPKDNTPLPQDNAPWLDFNVEDAGVDEGRLEWIAPDLGGPEDVGAADADQPDLTTPDATTTDPGPEDVPLEDLWVADPGPPDVPAPDLVPDETTPEDLEPPPPPAPTHFELAEHWSPIWYHDTDAENYEADYMVAYDFDGDTVSNNNWDNLNASGASHKAYVYWSVVETLTHWYILYLNFHPRDWAKNCGGWIPLYEPCHENDMEGAMVVVRRGFSPYGSFEVLYTQAHNTLHIFTNNPLVAAASTSSLESTYVTFESVTHPELYVESKGHGVCALYYNGTSHCEHDVSNVPPDFGGGDGVVYRYKGIAQAPFSGNDHDVGYDLVPLKTSLWPRRYDVCGTTCTFDTTMVYDGIVMGKAFNGDDYGDDKANPPWAWDDPNDGPIYRGDFFFRPAKTLKTHLNGLGFVSQIYTYNPYLDSLVPGPL